MNLTIFTFMDRKIKYRLIILVSAIVLISAILGATFGFLLLFPLILHGMKHVMEIYAVNIK